MYRRDTCGKNVRERELPVSLQSMCMRSTSPNQDPSVSMTRCPQRSCYISLVSSLLDHSIAPKTFFSRGLRLGKSTAAHRDKESLFPSYGTQHEAQTSFFGRWQHRAASALSTGHLRPMLCDDILPVGEEVRLSQPEHGRHLAASGGSRSLRCRARALRRLINAHT